MTSKHFLYGLGLSLLVAGTAVAQANDDCTGATAITGFNTFPFDNSMATPSGVNDCNGLPVRKDLWYEWTAPTTDFIRFETCGTTTAFDTRIAVYDAASTCANLNLTACAGPNCGGLSQVSFSAVQGQTYLMRVGSRQIGAANAGAGQFVIRIDPCPPTNDDSFEENDECSQATQLGNGTYNNLWVSKIDPDWYQFCVDPGGIMQIDVLFTHNTGDLDIFAFDACGGGSLGIGGSATDNENLTIDNSGGTSVLDVFLRVEHWAPDPNADCNFYSMVIGGGGASCGGGGGGNVGTNYCTAVPNSTGVIASLSGMGSDVVADNDLTLQTDDLPQNSFAFYLTSQTQGFAMNPGGSTGNICLAGSIGRYVGPGQIQNAGTSGSISLQLDLTQMPSPTGFVAAMAGETWNFQTWYRDVSGGSATSNFSDGLSVAFQ